MKKLLSLILCVLMLPVLSLAETTSIDLTSMTDQQLAQLATDVAAEQSNRIQSSSDYIVSGELGNFFVGLKSSYVKDDVLYLVFDYSHSSDEAEAFGFNIGVKCFQDGIACDDAFVMEKTNISTEIKSGATLEVMKVLKITSESPVEIEIKELFSFSKSDPILEALVSVK